MQFNLVQFRKTYPTHICGSLWAGSACCSHLVDYIMVNQAQKCGCNVWESPKDRLAPAFTDTLLGRRTDLIKCLVKSIKCHPGNRSRWWIKSAVSSVASAARRQLVLLQCFDQCLPPSPPSLCPSPILITVFNRVELDWNGRVTNYTGHFLGQATKHRNHSTGPRTAPIRSGATSNSRFAFMII